jgi:hypothetical protein
MTPNLRRSGLAPSVLPDIDQSRKAPLAIGPCQEGLFQQGSSEVLGRHAEFVSHLAPEEDVQIASLTWGLATDAAPYVVELIHVSRE